VKKRENKMVLLLAKREFGKNESFWRDPFPTIYGLLKKNQRKKDPRFVVVGMSRRRRPWRLNKNSTVALLAKRIMNGILPFGSGSLGTGSLPSSRRVVTDRPRDVKIKLFFIFYCSI